MVKDSTVLAVLFFIYKYSIMSIQSDFIVKNGMVVRNTATISTIDNFVGTSTDVILSQPTLNLDFTKGVLDPRITFTRASGATYVGQDGFIKYANPNQPRFDYDPANTGTALGLLIEDQRTHMYRWATTITTATWTPGAFFNVPLKENALQSPDGAYNAPILFNTPNVNSLITPSRDAFNTNTYYTKSIYVKYLYGWNHIYFQSILSDGTTSVIDFDIQNGVVQSAGYGSSTGTSSITSVGNGWYRCVSTFLTLTTGTTIGDVFYIAGYGSSNLPSAMGVWGAQCEASAFATSIIPTTSAAATRAAESATIAGSSYNNFINQTQGTLYFEGSLFQKRLSAGTGYPRMLSLIGTDQQNYEISIYTRDGVSDPNYGYFFAAAVNNATGFDRVAGGTQTVLNTGKAVFRYNLTNPQMYANGVSIVNPSPPSILPTTVALSIMGQVRYQNMPFGRVRRVMYWNTGLTDPQLSYLSSATTFTGTNFANLAPRTTYTANTSNFIVQQGVVVRANLEVPDVDKLYVDNLQRPTQPPSLNLNFLTGILDPRITFTRSSGATVIGSDGYIKYVRANQPRFNYSSTSTGTCLGLLMEEQRTNLFPYSLSIGGTNWNVRDGTTSTLNVGLAPDGTNGATLVAPTSGDGYVWQFITVSTSTAYVFSVYAKTSSGSPTIRFNAYTGVSGQPFTSGTSNLTSNYTRYSFNFTSTATVSAGDIGFYIQSGSALTWGAQLEVGTFATSIIPTSAVPATRAVDYTSISGQNLYSWYNPLQGTIYTESDSITTTTQTGAILDISDISDSSRISIYRQSDRQPVVQYYIPDPVSNVQIGLGAIWTDLSVRKLSTSYSVNNFYIATNAVTSSTLTAGSVPGNISRVSIGSFTSGASPANGHIRRVVYYPVRLSNTATYALTIL
jgi:hypothetical protein